MRILIVEDHADSASTLETLVQMHGHVAEIASTMAKAIAVAALSRFDFALIDLGLPDGDGADLGPMFLAKGIKCIATSGDAHALAELREGSGFATTLPKPFNISDLVALLDSVGEK